MRSQAQDASALNTQQLVKKLQVTRSKSHVQLKTRRAPTTQLSAAEPIETPRLAQTSTAVAAAPDGPFPSVHWAADNFRRAAGNFRPFVRPTRRLLAPTSAPGPAHSKLSETGHVCARTCLAAVHICARTEPYSPTPSHPLPRCIAFPLLPSELAAAYADSGRMQRRPCRRPSTPLRRSSSRGTRERSQRRRRTRHALRRKTTASQARW
jgi:hypothetical protein